MLLVLFSIGNERYGMSAAAIRRVEPDAALRPLTGTPVGVVGLLTAPEGPIPVIDLSLLTCGQPAPERLNTRILIVDVPAHGGIGLRVEQADDAVQVDPDAFEATGVLAPDAAYLGPVVRLGGVLIQRVEPEQLLTPSIQACLAAAEGLS